MSNPLLDSRLAIKRALETFSVISPFLSDGNSGTPTPPSGLTLTHNKILIGDAGNLASEVTPSGAWTISDTGVATLATVNANVGTFGSATQVPQFTVNAKGLITAAANVTIAGVSPVGSALTRGSIFRGSAAGAVEALAVGSAGAFLRTDGTDTLWSTGFLAITAAKTLTVSDSATIANAAITLANTGSLTLPAAATTITGGGTLALGTFTLTVPATGTVALATGISGGQTIYGGTAANDDLTLEGTSHATKTTSYVIIQPTSGNVGIHTTTPSTPLEVVDTTTTTTVSILRLRGGTLASAGGRVEMMENVNGQRMGYIQYGTASPLITGRGLELGVRFDSASDTSLLAISSTTGTVVIGTGASGGSFTNSVALGRGATLAHSNSIIIAAGDGTATSTAAASTINLGVSGTLFFTSTTTSATWADPFNFAFGTSTGTKIGTATNQKIGFFNATPVVQQTGNITAGLNTLGLFSGATLKLSGIVYPHPNTYISGSGTAGADGTAQTVKTVVLTANSLTQVGDRVRIRTYWRGDTGAPITATVQVNGVTTAASTDSGAASFFVTENYLHYVDATHANILEGGAYPATGTNTAANVAGFNFAADQNIDVLQNNVADNHIVVLAIIVDVFPKGV